jgi:hypothetical protein
MAKSIICRLANLFEVPFEMQENKRRLSEAGSANEKGEVATSAAKNSLQIVVYSDLRSFLPTYSQFTKMSCCSFGLNRRQGILK